MHGAVNLTCCSRSFSVTAGWSLVDPAQPPFVWLAAAGLAMSTVKDTTGNTEHYHAFMTLRSRSSGIERDSDRPLFQCFTSKSIGNTSV